MGEKLIEILEEACQEIAKDVLANEKIKSLRVKKAKVNLEIEILLPGPPPPKNKIKDKFIEELKNKLVVPVKLKVDFL